MSSYHGLLGPGDLPQHPCPVTSLASSSTDVIIPLLTALRCEPPCSSLIVVGMLCTGCSLCLQHHSPDNS